MEQGTTKKFLFFGITALILLTLFGILWIALGERSEGPLGWYIFSYAMGLTMIVLPCTFPLAFVVVPLALKGGARKGIGIALCFGVGVAITLSMYGIVAAIVGQQTVGKIDVPLETVKNWVYFAAGIFAYLFALGEIGLIKIKMPSYTGAAPAFIQNQQDYVKALLLGLFLGNIGVGCPHPATPLILLEIASSQNIFYGWTLFLIHAIGRVIPLLLLTFFALLGVNALSWLTKHKDRLERGTGWAMVFVAAFILCLGLFTHAWWVNSGQHTLIEEITGEEFILSTIIKQFNLGGTPHAHGPEEGVGLFGLPLALGNWVLVILWIVPLWWYYLRNKSRKEEAAQEENPPQPVNQ